MPGNCNAGPGAIMAKGAHGSAQSVEAGGPHCYRAGDQRPGIIRKEPAIGIFYKSVA